MLPLDSPKWSELQHAYGDATDLPHLLKAVYVNPYACDRDSAQDKIWQDLWGCICHQGDIGSASFAAVPHLVEAALNAKPGILAWSLIDLPVQIELSRLKRPVLFRQEGQPPAQPDGEYHAAISRLDEVCDLTAKWGRDENLSKCVRIARRLLSRRRKLVQPKQKEELGPLFAS